MTKVVFNKPIGVEILSILLFLFSLFAFFGSLFMWGEGFLFSFPTGVDYTYPLTDILINAPASMIAAIGLWRMKRYGYNASQFVAGFYIYASVEIFVDLIQEGPPYALEIVLPQILAVAVGIALVVYLWRIQEQFQRNGVPVRNSVHR
jgi:hypothetical protein